LRNYGKGNSCSALAADILSPALATAVAAIIPVLAGTRGPGLVTLAYKSFKKLNYLTGLAK